MTAERRVRYFLFCDQVREETNHKNLYVGAYGASMIIEGSFPAVLSSFVMVICLGPEGVGEQEKVVVSINVPGLETEPTTYPINRKNPYDSTTLNFSFSPFVIPSAGAIRVTVKFEDGHEEHAEMHILDRQAYEKAKATQH